MTALAVGVSKRAMNCCLTTLGKKRPETIFLASATAWSNWAAVGFYKMSTIQSQYTNNLAKSWKTRFLDWLVITYDWLNGSGGSTSHESEQNDEFHFVRSEDLDCWIYAFSVPFPSLFILKIHRSKVERDTFYWFSCYWFSLDIDKCSKRLRWQVFLMNKRCGFDYTCVNSHFKDPQNIHIFFCQIGHLC